MCIGLAFTLPQTYYGTAMLIGAIPSYYWAKRNPKSFDILGYAVAAGLIAGEGIGGVINAIFQVSVIILLKVMNKNLTIAIGCWNLRRQVRNERRVTWRFMLSEHLTPVEEACYATNGAVSRDRQSGQRA